MIKSFATEIISINRRKKKPDVIHDKHSHRGDVDRWTWRSVHQSKPSSVDSQSSSDWFSRELLGRLSLDSSTKCSESDWPSESWTWGVKDCRFDTVFLLRTRCSNASVFWSYTPSRGSPWLLARGSYSHRRNTETKVPGLEREFLVCGRSWRHSQNKKFSFAVRNVSITYQIMCGFVENFITVSIILRQSKCWAQLSIIG